MADAAPAQPAAGSTATAGVGGARWDLYRVLSEPVRLRLLALAAEEELAIGELAELLGESQPNISRHTLPLKQAGLVVMRKQGTRTLVSLADDVQADPVVADALGSGRALCQSEGCLQRVAEVLRARDAVGREYFASPRGEADAARPAAEMGAYLAAMSLLLPRRDLAIDVGTGDGGLLDVLAPSFRRVIGVDRSEAQLGRARERVRQRGWDNVTLTLAELTGDLRRILAQDAPGKPASTGADAVFAVRVLHHAPRPAEAMATLADLTAPGGALVVLDYARHDDESMRNAADLWLGFEPEELKKLAHGAGLSTAEIAPVSSRLVGRGPDSHLPWQVMVARKASISTV